MTGGASGIGAATVARFRADRDAVAVLDRDTNSPAAGAAETEILCDVTDPGSVTSAIDEAAAALGGLDVLVSCAGVAGRGTVADVTLEEWDRVFAVNVRGLYLAAQAAIPHLRRSQSAAIVNVASQLGIVAAPNAAAYCASKGAAVHLTRAMALDHAADGIRVNAVCPGPTDTPMVDRFFADAKDPDAERRMFESAQVHNRLVAPDEIAGAIFYLASRDAGSTIGACLVVDGGYSIR